MTRPIAKQLEPGLLMRIMIDAEASPPSPSLASALLSLGQGPGELEWSVSNASIDFLLGGIMNSKGSPDVVLAWSFILTELCTDIYPQPRTVKPLTTYYPLSRPRPETMSRRVTSRTSRYLGG